MEQFTSVTGIVAPLMRPDIDTDIIIPSREITSPSRDGYGEKAFAPWRYQPSAVGAPRVEIDTFVLNRVPYREASVLITGANFGSGSSREMAVWAIRQFGFRVIIAPSFGTIFRNNCYRNGVLPVVLPEADVATLAARAEHEVLRLCVDLQSCTVRDEAGASWGFTVPTSEREMMLSGLDAIGQTLTRSAEIAAFEAKDRVARPWVWLEMRSENTRSP